MLKVELHTHTADDPVDDISHSTEELIDRAAALEYQALAITLHDHQLDLCPHLTYAAARRLTLIAGIERTIEGRHVLLLNFSRASESVDTFEDLARLKSRESAGLVVAPHPFFPIGTALREQAEPHAALFDAIEYNAMFTFGLNFNRRAERWARSLGKPMVGAGDVHVLAQLGSTFSLVDATPTPDAICAAIRAGRVQVAARPLSWPQALVIGSQLVTGSFGGRHADQALARRS